MTNQTFIENATTYDYTIYDQDGHKFGFIRANGYYGLPLNFSPTFPKQYVFMGSTPGNVFTIWLGIDGEIQQIFPNHLVHLDIQAEEYHTRTQLFRPPLKTSNQVTACCHLYGSSRNKLMITPMTNIFARINPLVAVPVPDRVLRLDFHP